MNATVLVTGGAGFIGSHVVDELLGMGCRIICLDDLSGGFRENVNPKAEFVEGSINNESLVKELFARYHFDYVFHMAAYAAEGLSHFIKRFNYENNLIGSINLMNASINHAVKCFIFTSSIAVYGSNSSPFDETMVPRPEDSYGIAKLAVELELQVSRELFGLNYVIFRPHNVFGERQNIGDKYRNVVGIFINQILQEKPLTVFGDGSQTRAFSYIKEVAPVIAQAVSAEAIWNQTFNLGSDEVMTINELAQKVSAAMGVETRINYLPERKEVKEAYCSHEKIRAVFPATRRYSFDEGLERMIEWAKQHGSRQSNDFAAIEITKQLPDSWR